MSFHYLQMANYAMYNRLLMEMLSDTGLTAGQPKVLDYLGEHDGASQKDIAANCYIEPATLTSVLNGMEAKEFIERKRLNGNRRTFHIFLTEKGKEKQRRVADAFAKMETETFKGYSKEQEMELVKQLWEIHKRLTTLSNKEKQTCHMEL